VILLSIPQELVWRAWSPPQNARTSFHNAKPTIVFTLWMPYKIHVQVTAIEHVHNQPLCSFKKLCEYKIQLINANIQNPLKRLVHWSTILSFMIFFKMMLPFCVILPKHLHKFAYYGRFFKFWSLLRNNLLSKIFHSNAWIKIHVYRKPSFYIY